MISKSLRVEAQAKRIAVVIPNYSLGHG
jgi:hypothetical protein